MKKVLSTLLPLSFIFLIYLFESTSAFDNHNKRRCRSDSAGLLQTHWKQMGGFQAFTPDRLRLGCWSTALAQIVYYHRLKPFGSVQYTSRNGYNIDERLDDTQFEFDLFRPSIDSSTTEAAVMQIAKYNYYAALAVQKDFGTDRYMNKLAPASLLERHYPMQVKRYISWRGYLPYTHGKLEKIIREEIDEKRPVLLHFANLKDFGHTVVVDGYCYREQTIFVHLNQGQGGPMDGWYDLNKGLLRRDDDALRVIYTFKPHVPTTLESDWSWLGQCFFRRPNLS